MGDLDIWPGPSPSLPHGPGTLGNQVPPPKLGLSTHSEKWRMLKTDFETSDKLVH